MLDDDVKAVKNLESELRTSLKGRETKYSDQEKQLCNFQTNYIESHRQSCPICKASYESYISNMNIPMTPPCQEFMDRMKNHIESCKICNSANSKWNEDGIPITETMRKGVAVLSKLRKLVNK